MANILTYKDVKEQSETVFRQFGESKWLPFTAQNAKLTHRNGRDLANVGIGRVAVSAVMGASLEKNIDAMIKYRDRYDLITNDKCFGILLEHGLKADYVVLCDCNIPYRWIEKYIPETKDVKLIANCYANPEWTTAWLGERYFFINRDSLESEKKFLKIMPANTMTIPAGSNVSNAIMCFFLNIDEKSSINFAGYEHIFLVGYDYCWKPDGSYYAFANPVPKRNYMNNRTLLDFNGDIVFTSENLFFSAKWLYSYLTAHRLPYVWNCSGSGLLDIPHKANLAKMLDRVNADPEYRKQILTELEAVKKAKRDFEGTVAQFEKSRGGIFK